MLGLTPAQAQTSPVKELRIGAFVTASGPGADLGAQMRAGIEVALERMVPSYEIGGQKVPVRVFWYDDEGKAEVGVNVVTRALTVDKINVGIGFNSSDIVLRVMDDFQRANTPFITCCAAAMKIGEKIAAQKMNLVFQLSPTASDLSTSMVGSILANRKPKKIGILFYNIEYGRDLSRIAIGQLKTAAPDAEVVAEEYVPLGTSDYTPQLSKFKRLGVDTIITDIYGAGAPIFFQQYEELRVPAMIAHIGTTVSADSFIAQNARPMNGSLVIIRWIPGDYTAVSRPMVSAYTEKMKTSPTSFSVQAHDTAVIALEAVRAAGTLAPDTVANAIETGNFAGAWGMRKFLPLAQGHRLPADMVVAQIQGGKKVVVFPASVRTATGGTFLAIPPYPWEAPR
ncbi:MAG: ABC transporter substrate-binding protein [Alphaproteobacteria bacterium]